MLDSHSTTAIRINTGFVLGMNWQVVGMAEKQSAGIAALVGRMGMARSRDLKQAGFNPREISDACQAGAIEKVDRGLYALPRRHEASTGRQRFFEACKRVPIGVLCLQTALWYHGLISEEPAAVWMMIETNARKPLIGSLSIEFVRSSGDSFSQGIVTLGLVSEVQIRVYSPMKTVADCFRYADKVGADAGPAALAMAIAANKYNRQRLLRFAEICRVKQAVAAAEKARRKPASVEQPSNVEAESEPSQQRAWDRETLAREVWETPVRQLARKYGVSDIAVRKHCKRMGIALPGRGYWQKIGNGGHPV